MLREKQSTFVSQLLAPNTLLRDFRPDQEGNVAIVFCLMATVLMLAVGAAVDVGRWLHARDQTVAAVDAALLAGGRQLQTDGSDQDSAIAAAQKLYTQNTKGRLPVVGDSISFAVGNDGISIVANGTAYIQTPFLQIANIDKLPLIAEGQQPFAQCRACRDGWQWQSDPEPRNLRDARCHGIDGRAKAAGPQRTPPATSSTLCS